MANLYIHIPFCKKRCIYCDFYFLTTRRSSNDFVHALKQEIAHWADRYADEEPIETIYFGGGTPSLLPIDHVREILDCIHDHFETSQVQEVTFELNPDDAVPDYLTNLRQSGVDRLSIGIQSFKEKDLNWMNRAHNKQQALDVVHIARETGFQNFSVDLIFGLAHQSPEDWQFNLQTVLDLKAPHISTYSLTIEPRTPLYKQVQNATEHPVTEDEMARLYRSTINFLKQGGYEHYEVSSFALPGHRSLHNQSYWAHKNYLGFGPSAHSFWKKSDKEALRWSNMRSLKTYNMWPETDKIPLTSEESISLEQLADEYIMLRLRTLDGIDLHVLNERYHYDLLTRKQDALERFINLDLLQIDASGRQLCLTSEGLLVCDAITGELLA